MANNSSSMMKHHQEPAATVQQMNYQHHHQHRQQHQHHGGCDGGGGSTSSPSIQLQQSSPPSVVSYEGKGLVPGVLESSTAATATRFQPNLHGMSMDWTPEEQAILEDGMVRYANESNIVRYAKIAVLLKNKTVRDVALRCKWMTKRDSNRRRKEDPSMTRKNKERRDRVTDNPAMPSHAVMQPGSLPYAQGVVTNKNGLGISYNAIDAVTQELLKQNAQAFEQIHANLASCQMQNNTALFCQARDNISQILKRIHEPPYVMKQMPPLNIKVKELADAILLQSNLPMQ